jgi:hypothetical protein
MGNISFEGPKIAGALHSLYFTGSESFLRLYFMAAGSKTSLLWKCLLRFQWINENEILDK